MLLNISWYITKWPKTVEIAKLITSYLTILDFKDSLKKDMLLQGSATLINFLNLIYLLINSF